MLTNISIGPASSVQVCGGWLVCLGTGVSLVCPAAWLWLGTNMDGVELPSGPVEPSVVSEVLVVGPASLVLVSPC